MSSGETRHLGRMLTCNMLNISNVKAVSSQTVHFLKATQQLEVNP